MGFFKKIITPKKKTSVQNEEQAVKSAASTPTRSSSQGNKSSNTPKSSDKKSRPSPLKRIGRVLSRKKEIKLKSPDVKEGSGDGTQPQNYYTTNTDGYEVILEGKQLEFQSDPLLYDNSKEQKGTSEMLRNSTTFCAEDACAPLSDFPTFLSLLYAPNMDDIKNFVFGDTSKNKPTISTPQTTADVPPPMAEVVTKSASSSLPFDEEVSKSFMDEDESTADNDGTPVNHVSSFRSQSESIQSQKIAKIPINMNDVPTYQSPKNEKISHISSKSTTGLSDEEIYDSEFTLRFLRVSFF